jgi:hypothetical protein
MSKTPRELPTAGDWHNSHPIIVDNEILILQQMSEVTVLSLKDLKQFCSLKFEIISGWEILEYSNGILSLFDNGKILVVDFRPRKDENFDGVLFSGKSSKKVKFSRRMFTKQINELGVSSFAHVGLQIDDTTRIVVGWQTTSNIVEIHPVANLMPSYFSEYQKTIRIVRDWVPYASFETQKPTRTGVLLLKMKKNKKGKYVFEPADFLELRKYFPALFEQAPVSSENKFVEQAKKIVLNKRFQAFS